MKMNHLPAQKNKPKTKPISSKAKMNLKSLAGKSGHTRKNLELDFSNNDIRMTGNKNKDF
jgi:hypothetical protein